MELGLAAESLGITKKAKTHKGRKIQEHKAPKLIENPKAALFVKGNKSSATINSLLKELHIMRGGDLNRLFLKKTHDIHPFDDVGPLEAIGKK